MQGRSAAAEFLSLCLSEKIFISPSVLKGTFAEYRILGWMFFFKYFILLSFYGFWQKFHCNYILFLYK